MANHYTHVSFSVALPTAEVAAEAANLFGQIEDLLEQEDASEDGIEWEAEFAPFKEFAFGVDLCVEAHESSLWIRDDCGNTSVEFIAEFLKLLLNRYLPGQCLGFEWSSDCSRHLEGAFGGGLAFVTEDKIDFVNTGQLLSGMLQNHRAQEPKGSAPDKNSEHTCGRCGTNDVEVCLPAFFALNDNLNFVSVDLEAEALSYYCNQCEDDVPMRAPCGEMSVGRWSDPAPKSATGA